MCVFEGTIPSVAFASFQHKMDATPSETTTWYCRTAICLTSTSLTTRLKNTTTVLHLHSTALALPGLFFLFPAYLLRLHQIGEGSRKTALWVKMKPEYSDQTEDVDLLILAAGFANGKMRSGLLSKFLVGVAVPTEEDGQTRKQFHALVRVSSGRSSSGRSSNSAVLCIGVCISWEKDWLCVYVGGRNWCVCVCV